MKKTNKNDMRNALNRELRNVKLSEQTKRDILLNAQRAPRRAGKKPVAYAMWAAAAMVVVLGASLIASGSRVLPDIQRHQPLSQGTGEPVQSSGAQTEGDGENSLMIIANPDAEPTMVPAEMTDLFLRYEYEEIMPAADEQMLWGTEGGMYYHLVSDCSGMQNAVQMSRSEVSASGKQPCPVCIAFVTPTPMPAEPQITMKPQVTAEPSPTPVAEEYPAYDAVEPTEQPAPSYLGTENGRFFHLDAACSGMKDAKWLSDLTGKQPCPVCVPTVTPRPTPATVTPEPSPTPMPTEEMPFDAAKPTEQPHDAESAFTSDLWGTEHGTYYHIIQDCSGMKNARRLSDLTDKQPCPICIGNEFWITSAGEYYHLNQNCSGMKNAFSADAVVAGNSCKYPCPVCVGVLSAKATPEPTEMPEVVYDAQDEPGESVFPGEIDLVRYTLGDGCIMELEYDYNREFSLIDRPADLESWYVDEADADRFGTGDYLAGLIAPEDIRTFENTCAQNGEAGFEIRDITVLLNDVETQTSSSTDDLPSGVEYRFTGTEQPGKCILYSLDRPLEGDAAEITVVERLQQYWFDGEKYYRALVDDSTKVQHVHVDIRDAGEAIADHEPLFFYFDGEMTALSLEDVQYVIAVANDNGDLSQSALIAEDGSAFVPDMVINQTSHSDETVGWRYPTEDADKFEFIRLSDGENACVVHPDIPGFDAASARERLSLLLASCGVTDSDAVDRIATILIALGENGNVSSESAQAIVDILMETGLTRDEIAAGYMVNNVIAILNGNETQNESALQNTALERLSLLLASCGVTDSDAVQRTASTHIVLSENGDITAIASQPVLDTLLETGLSEEEINQAGLVAEIISILSEGE